MEKKWEWTSGLIVPIHMNDSLQKLRVSVSSFEKEEQADMLDKLKAIEQQLLHSKILHSDMEEQKDCKSVRGIIKHQVAKLRYMWYVIGCRMPLNDLIRVLFGSCLRVSIRRTVIWKAKEHTSVVNDATKKRNDATKIIAKK